MPSREKPCQDSSIACVIAIILYKLFRAITFERYGVSLLPSNRIGTIEECQNLFANAGNESDRIETEQHASHISLDTVEDAIAFGKVRSWAG
ncbi:MAG TPA: hypothetical protein V6D09_14910 [Leptolyngbyaceae cyanobacterium]